MDALERLPQVGSRVRVRLRSCTHWHLPEEEAQTGVVLSLLPDRSHTYEVRFDTPMRWQNHLGAGRWEVANFLASELKVITVTPGAADGEGET